METAPDNTGAVKRYADVAELADAHGSGPCAARLKGSTPFVGTMCGYGITAVHQPSKLVIGVRPPLPAPLSSVGFPSGQRGQTVNLLAQLSMVRIHLPPPFTMTSTSHEVLFLYCRTDRGSGRSAGKGEKVLCHSTLCHF